MTDADDRLKALFAQDEPPARDLVFSTAVMEELARRRFAVDMALLSAVTVASAFALWLLWPSLAPVVARLSEGLMPVAATITVAMAAVLLLDRGIPAASGNHG